MKNEPTWFQEVLDRNNHTTMNNPLAVQVVETTVDGVLRRRLMIDYTQGGWRGYDLPDFATYSALVNRMYEGVFEYKGLAFKCDTPWKSEPRSGSFIFRTKLYQQIL